MLRFSRLTAVLNVTKTARYTRAPAVLAITVTEDIQCSALSVQNTDFCQNVKGL